MGRLLTELRKNKTELVLSRSYYVHKKGIVVTIVGELDDECGNVAVLKYQDGKERFEIPESIFWGYVEIKSEEVLRL